MVVARHRLQQSFSKAADGYDAQAQFQHVQTRRVMDAASMLLPETARLVDVGCGTGYFAQLAQARRPGWTVLGVDISEGMCRTAAQRCSVMQADAARLPLANASVDAAVSSLCLQWVEDKVAAFTELARVLKPGGRAVVASLGTDTLRELRAAAVQVELPLGLLVMENSQTYRAAIAAAGLEVTMFERSLDVEYYTSVAALLGSMRSIGAGNNLAEESRAMTGVHRWRAMVAAYEQQRKTQGLPATWERLFMVLRKPV